MQEYSQKLSSYAPWRRLELMAGNHKPFFGKRTVDLVAPKQKHAFSATPKRGIDLQWFRLAMVFFNQKNENIWIKMKNMNKHGKYEKNEWKEKIWINMNNMKKTHEQNIMKTKWTKLETRWWSNIWQHQRHIECWVWPQNMDHWRCFLANTSGWYYSIEGNRALKDKRKGQWNLFYFQKKTKISKNKSQTISTNLKQSQTISNNLKQSQTI